MRNVRSICLVAGILSGTSNFGFADSREEAYFSKPIVDNVIAKHGSAVTLAVYARVLSKMGVKSLYKQCNIRHEESYRFLYYPSFGEPFSVSVDHGRRRSTVSFIVQEDETSHTGAQSQTSGERVVAGDEWRILKAAIIKSRVFDISASSTPHGADGSGLIFEGCRKGTYHFTERWSPDSGQEATDLIHLGQIFVRIAGLNINIQPVVIRK